jgi:hypothetical protein
VVEQWWLDRLVDADPLLDLHLATLAGARPGLTDQARAAARQTVSTHGPHGRRAKARVVDLGEAIDRLLAETPAQTPTEPTPELEGGLDLGLAPWPRRLGLHEAAELWRTRAPASHQAEAAERADLTRLDIARADPNLGLLERNRADRDYVRQVGDLRVLDGEHATLGLLLDLHDLQNVIQQIRDRAREHAREQADRARDAVTAAGGTQRDGNVAYQTRYVAIDQAAKAVLDPVLAEQRRLARAGIERAYPSFLRSDRAYRAALLALDD